MKAKPAPVEPQFYRGWGDAATKFKRARPGGKGIPAPQDTFQVTGSERELVDHIIHLSQTKKSAL